MCRKNTTGGPFLMIDSIFFYRRRSESKLFYGDFLSLSRTAEADIGCACGVVSSPGLRDLESEQGDIILEGLIPGPCPQTTDQCGHTRFQRGRLNSAQFAQEALILKSLIPIVGGVDQAVGVEVDTISRLHLYCTLPKLRLGRDTDGKIA